jgi:hypothetical protein
MIEIKGVYTTPLGFYQARHLFFNWKQETRRERFPSAPIAFEKGNKTIGSYLTPPVLLKSLRD